MTTKDEIQSHPYYWHCFDVWLFRGGVDRFHSCAVGDFGTDQSVLLALNIAIHEDFEYGEWFYFSDLHKALEALQ